jgi:hypothetical protein
VNAFKPAASPHGRIAEQVPAFAAIGVIGYLVDATMTYVCAKYLGLSPESARPADRPGLGLVAGIARAGA